MSDQSRRSEEQREAARLERERKRAADRGEPAPPDPAPPHEALPPQTPPLASGPPKPAAAPTARPTPLPQTAPETAQPRTAPRKLASSGERPSGTVRPGAATAAAAPDPATPRRRSPGRHALLFGLVALVVVAVLFVANAVIEPFKGGGAGSVAVKIPAGANAGDAGSILADRGVVASAFFFELRATLGGDRGNLRAGVYRLRKGMSNGAALAVLTEVKPAAPVIKVVLPEGPARSEIAPVVKKQGVSGSYISASVSSKKLNPRSYGAPANVKSLEGFLFPATYELLKESPTARRLVDDQVVAFKRNFASVDMSYAKKKNLTAFDVVTLASIIEREVSLDRERALVAAVFYNRLRQSISLGADATTRFAVNNWNEPLTVSQLNSPSKYNTRRFTGLPPGPIGNPGLASIKAAAKPAKSDYLFFVVAPCRNGGHSFAKTDAEFQKLKTIYDNKRAALGGKDPSRCPKG